MSKMITRTSSKLSAVGLRCFPCRLKMGRPVVGSTLSSMLAPLWASPRNPCSGAKTLRTSMPSASKVSTRCTDSPLRPSPMTEVWLATTATRARLQASYTALMFSFPSRTGRGGAVRSATWSTPLSESTTKLSREAEAEQAMTKAIDIVRIFFTGRMYQRNLATRTRCPT